MPLIEYTANYVTQAELRRAYERLGHTSTVPAWSATLLIRPSLTMAWACPVLASPEEREESPARYDWHVIAEAGELDWPPLKPEDEIWPALLEKEPVPTGDLAERQAAMWGKTVEEFHRDALRRHYLGDAHIGGMKRNKIDINFDPIVRDWDATARELAAFVDAHRPPKLTAEQRVMVQGVRLAQLEAQVESTKDSLGRLMRNAARDQGEKLRRGFKADMAAWSGKSRPTVDAWLSDGGCCEGSVPDEDGAPVQDHAPTGH
ncbi:hypothetical protein [Streptomyces sp. CL12-4]|uniref:hypothetical protein n=1 Tax=Streptomyces sp. CL12-4 TaxID=2810306 RepID=UPI001EFA34B0|nr:hypothetical protein [Streptomyces sp. CL12-4]MCG8971846.1 hypothetical protein [Streptomyces sp. CL12-4]